MGKAAIGRAGMWAAGVLLAAGGVTPAAWAQGIPPEILAAMQAREGAEGGGEGERDYPPFEEVSKGFEKVVSTADGRSLYTLWVRERDGQMLAELPRNFESQRLLIAPTIAGGDPFMGVYTEYTPWAGSTRYVYWRQYDKRLALIEPNVDVRSSGDAESRKGVERVYTDRVVLDVPIVAMGPGGGPVVDLDALLVGQAPAFFGRFTMGANPALARVTEAKAFPQNVEVSIELPVRNGRLATIHYSISEVKGDPGYQKREADRRVGFFYTYWTDRAKNDGRSQTKRYINRWHLEKRDPKLKMSPPKEPIVFYIEHTTPVRYRRFVRDGILEWNKAFERVGIVGAIEVQQQDASTGAHMDKDPEDVRYNFVRWTNSNIGFAIGPSRAHPETGQILDADVVIDEGFLGSWAREYSQILVEAATRSIAPEALSWYDENPEWDPRLRLLPPRQRAEVQRQREAEAALRRSLDEAEARRIAEGEPPRPRTLAQTLMGAEKCGAARGKAVATVSLRLALDAGVLPLLQDAEGEGEGQDGAEAPDMLDGLPDWYVGQLLKDLVMHEVGHTLGLMHNFKASSIYTIEEINSEAHKGVKPIAGSVMDYLPSNIVLGERSFQGDVGMITIGPYDFWAIEWGYTSGDPAEVVKRVAEPELAFLADETAWGPDPLGKQWDLGRNNLDWVEGELALAEALSGKIIDRLVKDGDSWQRARESYRILIFKRASALLTASNWLGGAFLHRDFKGDPDARDPVVVSPAADQRRALKLILEHGLRDQGWALSPELLSKLALDQWWDDPSANFEEPDWEIHDTIGGIQSVLLGAAIDPFTLRRVLDNELRVPAGEDALTLTEVMAAVSGEVWRELDSAPKRAFTDREPMISSLRRNLQKDHLDRLISMSTGRSVWWNTSGQVIRTLAREELRQIHRKIEGVNADQVDAYTRAHLNDAKERIARALDAQFLQF